MKQRLRADDRGVSEVVGAILVFGLAVMLLGIIQAQAIPAANEQVEFNHNKEVQSDIIDLQEAASRTAAFGSRESVGIQTGTSYPSRLLFFNPGSPSGKVSTGDVQTAKIENVQADAPDNPSLEQYIQQDITGLETRSLTYSPNYNEYQNPPNSKLEYGVLYNENDNGENVIINPGSVISGNQITLLFFAGELTEASPSSLSIDTRPTSAPARTVSVVPAGPGEVTITLPTDLSADTWENDILDEELTPTGHVIRVEPVQDRDAVRIVLEGGSTSYDISMAQVGIGSDLPDPPAEYTISKSGQLVRTDQSTVTPVTFEVRDRYNNPVSDVDLHVAVDGQGGLDKTTVNTDSEGQATVEYDPQGTGGAAPFTSTIQASYRVDPNQNPNAFDANRKEDVAVTVSVTGQPSGTQPNVDSFVLNSQDTTCVNTDSGTAGTSLFGQEATQLNISWEASIGGGNELDSARIEMIDNQTGQTATSTQYSLDGQTAGDTVILRDRRPNDDSCDKDYTVNIVVESDGRLTDGDSLTAVSGVDYPQDAPPI